MQKSSYINSATLWLLLHLYFRKLPSYVATCNVWNLHKRESLSSVKSVLMKGLHPKTIKWFRTFKFHGCKHWYIFEWHKCVDQNIKSRRKSSLPPISEELTLTDYENEAHNTLSCGRPHASLAFIITVFGLTSLFITVFVALHHHGITLKSKVRPSILS